MIRMFGRPLRILAVIILGAMCSVSGLLSGGQSASPAPTVVPTIDFWREMQKYPGTLIAIVTGARGSPDTPKPVESEPGMSISGIDLPFFLPFFRGTGHIGDVLLTTAFMALLAGLLARFFSSPFSRMVHAAINAPVPTGIVGFLTMGALILLTVVYVVLGMMTMGLVLCLGMPIFAVAWLALNAALAVGWMVMCYPFGTLIMRRLGMDYSPVLAAAIGTAALTLGQGLLSMIPLLNLLAFGALIFLGSIGLGTVFLTRCGWRSYPKVITVTRTLDVPYADTAN